MRGVVAQILPALLTVFLVACGSGGGDGGSNPEDNSGSTYTISGKVIDSSASGMLGVIVELTGTSTSSTTTDDTGSYSFSGLTNGNYTITPSLTGYTFTPVSKTVAINNTDAMGQDFVRVSTLAWTINVIDNTNKVGNSIAVDSNNKIHVSYYSAALNSQLKYATNVTGAWDISTIGSPGVNNQYTAIALDSNNKAHIVANNAVPYSGGINYITNASGSWVMNLIAFGGWASIAIDLNNKAHVVYFDGSGLQYTTNESGAWVTSLIDSGISGATTSIGLDSNGKIHICYDDLVNYALKYATNVSNSWVTSTIDNNQTTKSYCSVGIDLNGHVHIAYEQQKNNSIIHEIKYANNASTAWLTTTIDAGSFPALSIDYNNKVHIGYLGSANELKYATNAIGAWAISVVDTSVGYYAFSTSIAVDSNNRVYISYYDYINGILKYAYSN